MSKFNLDGHELWSLPYLGPSCSWKYPGARRRSGLLTISNRTSSFLVLQAVTRRWQCQLVLLEAGEVFVQPESTARGFSSTPACRAPPRSQTWVTCHTHNYLVMFSWTATLFIPSSSEVPQGKSPDEKTRAIAAFCCTPNTTYHPSPFSLSVEYQLLSEFKLCCTHRCPCPVSDRGNKIILQYTHRSKAACSFLFFPPSWYSWQAFFVTTECSWMGMKGPVWREHGDRDCWETAGTELQVVVGDRIEFISSASQLSAPNPPLQSWSHEGNPRSGVLY